MHRWWLHSSSRKYSLLSYCQLLLQTMLSVDAYWVTGNRHCPPWIFRTDLQITHSGNISFLRLHFYIVFQEAQGGSQNLLSLATGGNIWKTYTLHIYILSSMRLRCTNKRPTHLCTKSARFYLITNNKIHFILRRSAQPLELKFIVMVLIKP